MTKYKDTRNGLLGLDFSTKLSAWLALGCISARQVHWALVDFEDGQAEKYKGTEGYGKGENKGTAAVRFELLWRDYMRLCTRKFGPRLFRLEGFRNDSSYPWRTPGAKGVGVEVNEAVERFMRGATGTSLIDASNRELYLTGYTSNRARQNVASYLSKHLGIDWRIGAEWYEYCLTDYDVSSNWGNWQYVSGVGNGMWFFRGKSCSVRIS
jgi:deoxyribodipyrimidine photo-lyase